MCAATPTWGELRDFVAGREDRDPWWSNVQLRDGTPMMCKIAAIQNGATMVSFRSPSPSIAPASQERFSITHQAD